MFHRFARGRFVLIALLFAFSGCAHRPTPVQNLSSEASDPREYNLIQVPKPEPFRKSFWDTFRIVPKYPPPPVYPSRWVVFVTSASVADFDMVRGELRKAITSLRPVNGFNIIYFRDDQEEILFAPGLLMANKDGLQWARRFIDHATTGKTCSPISAMKLAFAMDPPPQLIYLLVGDDYAMSADEVGEIHKLNAAGVKINTIGWAKEGSEDNDAFAKAIEQIASENGGVYKFVTPKHLQQSSASQPAGN